MKGVGNMIYSYNNQEKFIEKLFEEHYSNLERMCRRMLHFDDRYLDLISECLQETYLQAVESYETLKNHPEPKAWLYKVCINRLIPYAKLQRSRQKHFLCSLDSPDTVEPASPIDVAEQISRKDAAKEMIETIKNTLSPTELEIFNTRFIENLSITEIAEATSLSQGNVRAVISRIRKKARKLFDNNFLILCVLTIVTIPVLVYCTK